MMARMPAKTVGRLLGPGTPGSSSELSGIPTELK
jgi:hypothetical protein